jgi:hypothetical protein
MNNHNEPQFTDFKTELLNPETNYSVIRTFPPDMSPEARHACEKIIRVREQMEQPLHRPQNLVQDDLSSEPSAEASGSRQSIRTVDTRPSLQFEQERTSKKKPRSNSRKKRRARAKSRHRALPVEPDGNDLAHEARCSICQHQLRPDIDEEFTHWHSPENIAYDYEVSMRSLYRHARHKNLFAVRDRNLRYALGHVIDRVERIPVMTPESIVRAVHAFARINDQGHWVEPPKHVIFSTAPSVAAPAAEAFNVAVSVPGEMHPASLVPMERTLGTSAGIPPQLPSASALVPSQP